jgi:hypothetical protein
MTRKPATIHCQPTQNARLVDFCLTAAFALMSCFAVGASADEPQPEDPIIVPTGAKEVDYINRFGQGQSTWSTLNSHMVVAEEGAKNYLIVFEAGCRNLLRPGAKMKQMFTGSQLNVRSVVTVDGMPCQIDHIYSITDEDNTALRKQLGK